MSEGMHRPEFPQRPELQIIPNQQQEKGPELPPGGIAELDRIIGEMNTEDDAEHDRQRRIEEIIKRKK